MYDESGGGTVTPCISHADVIEAKESGREPTANPHPATTADAMHVVTTPQSKTGCGRIFETDLSHILPEQVGLPRSLE